ncbi:hypothetical protein QL285_004554 [Trifolium repens]|nr:hypothetical protein QL285_004554 [Trifolium repens]
MVFGKRKISQTEPLSSDTHESQDASDEDVSQTQTLPPDENHKETTKPPLSQEVIYNGVTGKNPGGTKNWTCKHCKKSYKSTYTRIHYHFFGPPPGKRSGIQRCSTLLNDREAYEKLKKRVQEAEKSGVSPSLKSSTITKKDKALCSRPLEESFQLMGRDAVDMKIIRGLCANGIPFNVLRNPQFVEMVMAINKGPEGYKPPSSEKARTTLLDECKRHVDKDLAPIKDTWYHHGVSIVSDGWSNIKHKPLINVLAVNSRSAMFMYAEDFSGVEKTGIAIAEFLIQAIEEIGPSNVLQVVTDNAANCKAAGKEVQKVYKHIFWSPCVVHTLNLIFKDFAEAFEWLYNTYKQGKTIVKYILNHSQVLAIFRANSKLELLKVAKTRFASHYILLNRLLDCREALATTVVLNSWKEWVRQGDENTRKMGSLVAGTITSESFWEEVENVVKITKPIYLLIKFADGEGPKMGEFYEKMDVMLGEINEIMKKNKYASCYSQMEKIITDRWTKMNYTIHCLGFALTPRFYDANYLAKPAPGGIARKAPNQDKEVVTAVMEAFEKISENSEEQKLLRDQFARFHTKRGIYAMAAAQLDAVTMDAIDWWSTYGSETPELAEVAKKVLSQPISSSSAERSWSTYSYIHSVKRNRLNCARADKLVYIHSNIRLQSRFSESYKNGQYKNWDMDHDESYLGESSTREQDTNMELDNEMRRTSTKRGKRNTN